MESGNTEPSEQHLQHCLANTHKSEHSAAISKRQRLHGADRATRLPDRADGKLLQRMRTMKSPSSFSMEQQRRLRDAAALCTSGTLTQARATTEAKARSLLPVWLPISKHWQQSIGERAGGRAGNLPAGNRCSLALRANMCLSDMVSSHRWQQVGLIYHTSDLLLVEDRIYIKNPNLYLSNLISLLKSK